MLTATDPENAVSELDGEAPEDTSPQPAQQPVQEPATLAGYDLDAISEGLAEAQVVYQISLKNGAASSAWIDVDEAAYRSAKLYGEYKCRCLYTAPPQRKPLTDEEIKSMWGITEYREFAIDFARAIELGHGIGDA